MPEVNFPSYCPDCIYCQRAGEVMVGSDDCGGGPEESYDCEKGRNMYYYWYNNIPCPDYDDGMD